MIQLYKTSSEAYFLLRDEDDLVTSAQDALKEEIDVGVVLAKEISSIEDVPHKDRELIPYFSVESIEDFFNKETEYDILLEEGVIVRGVKYKLVPVDQVNQKTKPTNTRWCKRCETIRSPLEYECFNCDTKTEEIDC